MKLLLLIFLFFQTIKINSFFISYKSFVKYTPNYLVNELQNIPKKYNNKYIIAKIQNYNKLLRTNNCLPTFLLNLMGSWLANPSIQLFLNRKFWLFSLITQLTMMNSMVINDIFDLQIDKINNADRPLVRNTISVKEAKLLYSVIGCFIYFFTYKYLDNPFIKSWVYLTNFILFIYTPVLKKIPFIKNITCASIVSSTVVFSSSSITATALYSLKNISLIYYTSFFLFLSSLYIELLLDIRDVIGDKKYGIITVPNLFGEDFTIKFLLSIFINFYIFSIKFLNNKRLFIGASLSLFPFYKNLINLSLNNYSKMVIKDAMRETTISLLICVVFILLNC